MKTNQKKQIEIELIEYCDINNHVPADNYNVKIISNEVKRNKKSKEAKSDKFGLIIFFEMEILDGKFKGEKLFSRNNINLSRKKVTKLLKQTLEATNYLATYEKIYIKNEKEG